MPSQEPRRPNGTYRTQWRLKGAPPGTRRQSYAVDNARDYALVRTMIAGLDHRIADDDPRLTPAVYRAWQTDQFEQRAEQARRRSGPTYGQTCERYAAQRCDPVLSDGYPWASKTLRGFHARMRLHTGEWWDRPVASITPDAVATLRAELAARHNAHRPGQRLSSTMIESIMVSVVSVLKFGGVKFPPAPVRRRRGRGGIGLPPVRKRPMELEQILKIIGLIDHPQTRLIFRTLAETGGRIGEVLALTAGNLDQLGRLRFDHHMIESVRTPGLKQDPYYADIPFHEQVAVPVSAGLVRDLRAYSAGRAADAALFPMGDGPGRHWRVSAHRHHVPGTWRAAVWNVVIEQARAAGIVGAGEDFTPHTMKKFHSTLMERQFGLVQAALRVRHAVPGVTGAHYLFRLESDLIAEERFLTEVFGD